MIDFDTPVNRAGTSSLKFEGCQQYYGTNEVMPLWVADMDFQSPVEVTEALTARAEHGVFGYTDYPESVYASLQGWFDKRHQWQIARDSILLCPGVVPSLYAAVTALTEPGEQVIVQPPVYHPFFTAVTETGRTLLENPLKLVDGHYQFDFEHLRSCAEAGAKVLILCSPHNPVGRVWDKEELMSLLTIAKQYQMTIISDEIHADLIFPDQQHTVLATLAKEVKLITAVSPSKSFNIPGLGLSALVIDDAKTRNAIKQAFQSWHISNMNPFSIVGFETAYNKGEAWLDEVMAYLQETRSIVESYLAEHLPEVTVVQSEGTYLLWLDCRGLGLTDKALHQFFLEDAKVALSPGTLFGQADGAGFMRLNMATARSNVIAALSAVATAWRAYS